MIADDRPALKRKQASTDRSSRPSTSSDRSKGSFL